MPEGGNDTSIVLIPKKNDSEELKDFRPISLCNVIFKVVSKCLVNRLRPLLQDIISPTQSDFIPSRLIADNALMAFECIHSIRTGSAIHRKFCAYKLDMAKVYDHVDWRFCSRNVGFRVRPWWSRSSWVSNGRTRTGGGLWYGGTRAHAAGAWVGIWPQLGQGDG
jgi:hypothetical protein